MTTILLIYGNGHRTNKASRCAVKQGDDIEIVVGHVSMVLEDQRWMRMEMVSWDKYEVM